MNEERIHLLGSIDTTLAERMIEELKERVSDGCQRLHIAIQSPGGSVPVAMAMANVLMALSCPITTYNIGNVDSAALIIFAAGERRICAPKALFHVHPLGKMVEGIQTIDTLKAAISEIEEDTARVAEYMDARVPRIGAEGWATILTRATTLTARDAIDLGLAHAEGECRFA